MGDELNARSGIGHAAYVSPLPGFKCIFKQRYEDFVVHEMDESGRVVVLTERAWLPAQVQSEPVAVVDAAAAANGSVKEEPAESEGAESQAKKPRVEATAVAKDDSKESEGFFIGGDINASGDQLSSLSSSDRGAGGASAAQMLASTAEEEPLTPEQIAAIDVLVQSGTKEDKVLTKAQRKRIHLFVKGKYGNRVHSSTNTKDALNSSITITRPQKGMAQKRAVWPYGGDYVHFTMYKEMRSGDNALHCIANVLKRKRNDLSSAGNKDKRGVTTQRLSAYRIEPQRLAGLNKVLRGMQIGNYTPNQQRQIALGDSGGNEFIVVLREAEIPAGVDLPQMLSTWQAGGFLNFFGEQRFGTGDVSTAEIGRSILRGDFKHAVELLFKYNGDFDENKEARAHFTANNDAKAALELISNRQKFSPEALVLRSLVKNGGNAYKQAIIDLPRNSRSLYVHAYQALLWNTLLSERIKKHGVKVLPGDFVVSESEGAKPSVKPREEDLTVVDEATAAGVSPFRVVLPVIGANTPAAQAATYNELLAADGITLEAFSALEQQFALPGDYRVMLAGVSDVEHLVVKYSDVKHPVLITDLTAIDKQLTDKCTHRKLANLVSPDCPNAGDKTALVVKFNLRPGHYATMALRELTRQDLSKAMQASLNPSYIKKNNAQKTEAANESTNGAAEQTTEPTELKTKAVDSDVEMKPTLTDVPVAEVQA